MQFSMRSLLQDNATAININNLWPTLRQKQYYNAMCELKHELEILICIPDMDENLKIKMKRSLAKVTFLVNKLKEKI